MENILSKINHLCRPIFLGFGLSLFSSTLLQAQNLAINGDFEIYTFCPSGYIQPGNTFPCPPYTYPTWGTTDYLHSCSNPSEVGVPQSDLGWQYPHSGEGYIGIYARAFVIIEYREYLQGPIAQPLIAGKSYYVRFYVSLANERCGIQQIGAYFSVEPPTLEWGDPSPMTFCTPQVESNGPFLSDTMNWMLIEGCFVADGGEEYVTIGNFHSNANTPLDPNCNWGPNGPNSASYYYLDDLYIAEVQPGELDLDLEDGPLSDCESVTLESGVTGVNYVWNTGSLEPDITATSSGMYILTIYDGCEAGVDSVEVIILDAPPVALAPDITVCAGETVSVSLDPDLGEYTWNDGSNDTEYDIISTGTYSVSLDDGCDITTDQIYVYMLEPPSPFSLGGDTLLCTGDVLTYYFDPGLGEFEWQDGNNANEIEITEEGYYAVTITNMCGEESAELEVFEITPGMVQLPLNADTLCNGEALEISLNPTAGTYVWQDGSTDPSYQITNSGTYSVTMSDYCGNTADTIQVTALNTPSFEFGNTLTPCPGDSIFMTVSSPSANYAWQDGSTNDSLLILNSGTYALTITNACGLHHDTILVDFEDSLVAPDLGPDFSLCPGDDAILVAGNQNATYVWQDLSTADTLLVSSAGTYTVAVSNNCFSFTDTVVVSIQNDPPSLDMPDELVLCQNEVIVLDPSIGGVNFNWNDGSGDPTLTVSTPGTYSLTVSNACGSDVDTVIIQDGGPVPTVTLGNDTAICPGETLMLMPINSDVLTWLWSDGNINASLPVTQEGTYSVIASNNCGSAYDTIQVDLLDGLPVLNLGADTALCPGQDVLLNITFPNIAIAWSDGSTGPALQVNSAGIYYASISNACGSSTDTIEIEALDPVPTLNLGNDIPLCPGQTIVIIPGILNVDYLWQDGSIDTFFLVNSETTVTLTISNACGNSSDDLFIYSSTEGPDVELGDDITACKGETVLLASNISGVDYVWQDGSTGSSILVDESGSYYLHVSNACGDDTDTIQVNLEGLPPMVDLGADTVLCEGSSLILVASNNIQNDVSWQDGSTNPSFAVSQAGTYAVIVSNECGDDADTIFIENATLPVEFNLGPDTILCAGEVLTLLVPVTTDPWEWSDGSQLPNLLVNSSGVYFLIIENRCGQSRDEIEVMVEDADLHFPSADTLLLCPDKPIVLNVSQNFPAQYEWSTGSTLPAITITTPGLYSVTVDTRCLQDQYGVVVLPNPYCSSGIYIPNIFSPNQDQVNDIFTISVGEEINVLSISGRIFDRWGNQLFASQENPFTWDGTSRGEKMMPAVYVYTFTIEYTLGDRTIREKFTGDVTLMR